MSEPFKLYRLQQVDSQLDKAEARLSAIEAILGEDEEIRAAKDKVDKAAALREDSEKALHTSEDEVKDQQIKLEQNQAVLYGGTVSNPKELQDLQAEAQALNRHQEVLENIQLEKMLASEDAQNSENDFTAQLTKLEGEKAIEHGELILERDQVREEAARFAADRHAAVSGVDAKDMAVYEKLRGSKAGLAVAKVHDKSCTACGTLLSESLAQAARSQNELSHCSTCKRILYAG
jgi:predicted  nucleic acid-binding Zn-ribbon protein